MPGIPHHVTQRGNRRQDVFFSVDDRKQYLEWLLKYSNKYGFEIIAYCLMTNHVHFVGIPGKRDSISRILNVVNMRHSQYVNREHGWNGHLWQGRFFSCQLDDVHLWAGIVYVEQNPVRAGIVLNAWDYIWSSAASHCGVRHDPLVTRDSKYDELFDKWRDVLSILPDKDLVERIRIRTSKGLPCGDETFAAKISHQSGREVKIRERGRPRKGDKTQ